MELTETLERKNKTTPFAGLKVALVHDWLTEYRGGEKVLEEFCRMFPEAPLYTLVYKKGSTTPLIENRSIHPSFIQKMPLGLKKYRHYLPLFPLAAETLVPSGYDLIVSTSTAVAKSIRTHGTPHWCYINSPMRYVWDRFDDYFGPKQVGAIRSKLFFAPIAAALRTYDKKTAARVQEFIPNSSFIAKRVRDFYGIETRHINPPVDVQRFFDLKRNPEDFYLFFSALVPYKKADHAILACQKLGRRLVILGKGPDWEKLNKMADPNLTQFVHASSDGLINDYLCRARALLFPAVEDFGIVPVEASACGLPVIAIRHGGILDTQTTLTCQFYDEHTPDGLAQAILDFEKNESQFVRDNMTLQAKKFSIPRFQREIISSLSHFVDKFVG